MNDKIKGFSLMEALISLLLLSFAFIGIDAMEIMTLRDNHAIYFFNVATNQIKSMEARLHVSKNRENMASQLALWNEENKQVLPEGRGYVTGNFPDFTLTLFWGETNQSTCSNMQLGISGCITDSIVLA